MQKFLKILIVSFLLVILFTVSSFAAAPYDTYTYSYDGNVQISPAAYIPVSKTGEFGEAGALKNPNDILYDKERDLIIIADTGNSRIIVTDKNFSLIKMITEFDNQGVIDTFNEPYGIFLNNDGNLYVADTKNSRILVFDKDFSLIKVLPPISADILPEGFSYNPISVAVDNADNVYVVSMNTNMGVISLDPDGNFEGFFGAQEVSVNPLELVWRTVMSEEQLERSESYVSVEYSNLTIDEKGFVYVTCTDIDRYELYNAVKNRSNSSAYAPVKKLNPAGTDVLVRNGFFPPVGDINFSAYTGKDENKPSQISDIELLDNGMYALLDTNQNKLFTYDSSGNLLYAFGGIGEAAGLYNSLCALTWNDGVFYTLDSYNGTVTILERTEYGNLLDTVIGYQETMQYEKANELWQDIISQNNNFDMAYLGLGKIALEKGEYQKAMDYFEIIGDKTYYEKAYKLYREELLAKIGFIIFAVVIAVILLLIYLMGRTGKYNEALSEHPRSGKFKDELIYGLYVMRHPFKGFWGLKAEKRGSVRGATFWLALTGISSIFSVLGACYLQRSENPSVVSALSNTVFPLLLIVVSNMCFTTLMDGKGTFKDVYIAVSYSTVPYALCTIPFTLISYLLISDELAILNMCSSVVLAWVLFLVFFGLMTVHDYSFGKNAVVCGLTIVGIAFILFILIIFVSLSSKVISLIASIVTEVAYRS